MEAYKFVEWDIPPLDTLKSSRAYSLREKINAGEKMSRDEKNWLKEAVNNNSYSKTGIPLKGWMFSFRDALKLYVVYHDYAWREMFAVDKTALRHCLYGRVGEIIELPHGKAR